MYRMESADKENEVPNRKGLKGKHCRKTGDIRLTGSRRKKTPAGPRLTMMSTLTSFLSIIGCMACPVAAASLSSITTRKIRFKNRRQRRAAGERSVKRQLSLRLRPATDNYQTPVFRYDSSPKTYYTTPGPNHPKTKSAKEYDRSWYVPGTLKQPEYEIGALVWAFSRAGWIRAIVQANQLATETGLYQLVVEDPDAVAKSLGGVPVKLCLTMTAGGAHVLKRGKCEGDSEEESSDEDSSCCEDTSGSTGVAREMMNRSCGCFDIGAENFTRLTSQRKSKFAQVVESEDSDSDESVLGDMPGAQATARAEAFRADTDFLTELDAKYRRGESVWFYRRREKAWVPATVVDTRSVLMDGYYLVTIANGVKLEAFDQTLAPRGFDSANNVNTAKTAAWRGELYNAPMPCLAGGTRDDIRKIAISALQRAHPDDLYWTEDPQNKKQRHEDRIKMEKVYIIGSRRSVDRADLADFSVVEPIWVIIQ